MIEVPQTIFDVASDRCKFVMDTAADFVANLNVLLDQMAAEREEMTAQNVSRTDPRFLTFTDERDVLLAVIDAMTQSTTKAWVRLNSKPLSAAP